MYMQETQATVWAGMRPCSYLILVELVSTKGSNTRFDAASAQSDEEETHHWQRTEGEKEHMH